jgi:hypothetical protein
VRLPSCAAAPLLLAVLLALVRCGDVLHSTSDVRTACEIDASVPGCSAPARDAGPAVDGAAADAPAAAIDFCAWSPAEAQQTAMRACAWLGACETPVGANAFGDCALQARLAYNCAANPNHAPKGKAHDFWACAATVTSCADVALCALPAGPEDCADASPSSRCGTGANADTVIRCGGGSTGVTLEPCAPAGKTCVVGVAGDARCGGTGAGLDCENAVSADCLGDPLTQLHTCDADGGDFFIDCSSNGAQSCGAFPATNFAWVACVAEGSGPPCTPSLDVTCSGGVASSCPSGVPETIDCSALLGSPAACRAGMLSSPFDWSTPCGTTDPCPDDQCAGEGVTSCTRGASVGTGCAALGLGPCRLVSVADSAAPRAACSPP